MIHFGTQHSFQHPNCSQSNMTQENNSIQISFIVQSSLGVCANAALLIFIMTQRVLRCKVTNKFFMNLLTVHIILNFIGIVSKSRLHLRKEEVIINNGFLMEMFFSLIITTCDRYIYIRYPFKYERLTTKTVVFIILCSWVISAIVVALSVIFEASQYRCTMVSTSLILISSITLASSNINIYVIARRHANAIRRNSRTFANAKEETLPRITKSTYACFAIIISFVVLWCPYFVHNMMAILTIYTPSRDKVFTRAVVHIAWFNSLVDPALYICFNKNTKKVLRRSFQLKPQLSRLDSFTNKSTPITMKADITTSNVICNIINSA